MKAVIASLFAFFAATLGAHAQCASGYTQLNNVFACQANSGTPFNVGYTTVPTTGSQSGSANYVIVAGPYTMPQNGAPQSVTINMGAAATGFVGVYDATGTGGSAHGLLATSASTSLSVGSNTVNMTTTPTMASGTVFWLAFVSTTAGWSIKYDTSSQTTFYEGGGGRSSLPASLNTMNSFVASQTLGMYATFQ